VERSKLRWEEARIIAGSQDARVMGKIFHADWDDPTLSAVQWTMKSRLLTNMVEMDMRTYDYVCPLVRIQRFVFVISDRNGLDEPSKALDLDILILARTTTAGVDNDH
jgi:hypothetical protein